MKKHFWIVAILSTILTFSLVCSDVCGKTDCEFEKAINGCHWAKCPNSTNTTTAAKCKELGCCYAGDSSYVQEKNISINCIRREKSDGGLSQGICEINQHNDTLCPGLKSDNSTRYFDVRYNITGTIEILQVFFGIVNSLPIRQYCKTILLDGLCDFAVPKCLPSDSNEEKAQNPCREDCEYIFKECDTDVQQLFGALQFIVLQRDIDFVHLNIPYSCEDFEYSYKLPPSACAQIYANADRTPPEDPENKVSRTVVIIAVVAASVLVVTLLFAIVCISRQRRNKRILFQTEMQHVSNMTSIREHLRADTVSSNPLEELLASSKPGELLQYPLDCVEYIKELGEGQFGKVFQGRVHGVVKGEESTDVAVKCLKEGSSGVAKASFNQEVALMSVLQHDNILRLLAVSTEEEPYCMIFEFMENGDLNEFLRRWQGKDYLNDSQLIKICKYIASGMEYLASKKFLHRDLATRNCLVGQDLMVKIADFGMSRNVYHSDYYRVGGEAMLPIRWMPPESILYGKFTVASDVYSFGVVMWEVFSFAIQPFYGYSNEEVIDFIKKGVLLPMPEDCPEWIYNIMLSCWKRDPEERMPFTKSLQLLKGKFEDTVRQNASTTNALDNYDKVPSPSTNPREGGGYDKITVDQSSTGYGEVNANQNKDYDMVWNNADENNEATSEPSSESGPSYVNLKPEHQKKSSDTLESNSVPSFEILPPRRSSEDITSSPPGSPISPGTANTGFDDDEAMLLKMSNSSSSLAPKEGPEKVKSKSLTPLTSKKNKLLKASKSNTEGRSPKGFLRTSTGGGRSIKDVMRDGPRYVSSEDIRKSQKSKSDSNQDLPAAVLGDREYQSAFRPTSEFMQFHGYGESIQANDPDEAKLIKKILEDGR